MQQSDSVYTVFSKLFSIRGCYRIFFLVPYSKSLLFICIIHSSVYLLITHFKPKGLQRWESYLRPLRLPKRSRIFFFPSQVWIMGTLRIHLCPPQLPRPTLHQSEVRPQHSSASAQGLHSNWRDRCEKKVKTKWDVACVIPGGKEQLVSNTSFLIWFNSKRHKQLTDRAKITSVFMTFMCWGWGGEVRTISD